MKAESPFCLLTLQTKSLGTVNVVHIFFSNNKKMVKKYFKFAWYLFSQRNDVFACAIYFELITTREKFTWIFLFSFYKKADQDLHNQVLHSTLCS